MLSERMDGILSRSMFAGNLIIFEHRKLLKILNDYCFRSYNIGIDYFNVLYFQCFNYGPFIYYSYYNIHIISKPHYHIQWSIHVCHIVSNYLMDRISLWYVLSNINTYVFIYDIMLIIIIKSYSLLFTSTDCTYLHTIVQHLQLQQNYVISITITEII